MADQPSEHQKSTSPIGKPGYTGNPGGRPKMSEAHKAAFGQLSDAGIQALRDILNGTDKTARAGERLRAAEIVFDRNWGKALQQLDASLTERKPILYDKEHDTPDDQAR